MAEISQTLDQILNHPPEEWGPEQLQIYQILESKINHYRRHFLETQFRQDIQDIRDNILIQKWYLSATQSIKSAIDQLLKKLTVTTFNLARNQNSLRINLNLKIDGSQPIPYGCVQRTNQFLERNCIGLKLQYFHSPNKFLYYLYFEAQNSGNEQRAYLAHNHPELDRVSTSLDDFTKIPTDIIKREIPDLDTAYRKILPVEFRQIPAGLLMKLITEIIMFYDETGTVIKTPISPNTKWSLSDS